MAINFNIDSQIVVQTAAQWAVDATVYVNKRILVTSDVFYTGLDQPRFKFANGVDTWANLDYIPEGGGTNSVAITYATTGNTNLTDGGVFYLGVVNSLTASLNGTGYLPLPSGTVTDAYISGFNASTIGSSEAITVSLMSNNIIDINTITTALTMDARHIYLAVNGLSIAVTAGGSFLRFEIPTMATNPNAAQFRVTLIMTLS
jgi:hypothetical protein